MGHRINNPVLVVTIPGTPEPTVYDLTEDAASCTLDGARPNRARPLFGDTGQRRNVKGLFDGSVTIDFNHDYDDGRVTQLMWDALLGDDLIAIAIRAEDGEISADNPEWRCNVSVESFAAVNGAADELATGTLTLPIDGVPVKVTDPNES